MHSSEELEAFIRKIISYGEEPLTERQEMILGNMCKDDDYAEIAKSFEYSPQYMAEIGSSLLKKLNNGLKCLKVSLDKDVNKTYFISTLEKYWDVIETATIEQDLLNELEVLLRRHDFQGADTKTADILSRVARTSRARFEVEETRDFPYFPCEDLRIIDDLWTRYSDGHFGFSVQRSIWLSDEVNRNFSEFAKRIGWAELRENYDGSFTFTYLNFRGIDFSVNAPKGELPWLVAFRRSEGDDYEGYLSRIEDCNI